MIARLACSALVLLSIGCTPSRATIGDAFPRAASASPWILVGEVWNGSFDEAAGAIGDEAARWSGHHVQRVWLAVYQHEQHTDQKMTIRVFDFASKNPARVAFESVRPTPSDSFDAGDEGCWTKDGVLFRWGRAVFELFGNHPDSYASPERAALFTGYLERNMPPQALETSP